MAEFVSDNDEKTPYDPEIVAAAFSECDRLEFIPIKPDSDVFICKLFYPDGTMKEVDLGVLPEGSVALVEHIKRILEMPVDEGLETEAADAMDFF